MSASPRDGLAVIAFWLRIYNAPAGQVIARKDVLVDRSYGFCRDLSGAHRRRDVGALFNRSTSAILETATIVERSSGEELA